MGRLLFAYVGERLILRQHSCCFRNHAGSLTSDQRQIRETAVRCSLGLKDKVIFDPDDLSKLGMSEEGKAS